MGDAADDAFDEEDRIRDVKIVLKQSCPDNKKKCNWEYADPEYFTIYRCKTCGVCSDGF